MRALVLDPPPAEFERLLERRRAAGADHHDEVWEGVLHMAPAPHARHASVQAQLLALLVPAAQAAGLRALGEFNLGEPEDYRVPDGGLLDAGPPALYERTARLALEVLSPGDETAEKLPFYAARGVEELLLADPEQRTVRWLALGGDGAYHQTKHTRLIDLDAGGLAERIAWPE